MKLLLTSGGVRNTTIRGALDGLLPKPLGECRALLVTTSSYALRNGADMAYQYVTGTSGTPMAELGWQAVGLLEPAALPSLPRETWAPWVESADAILVNGGDPMYLCHWIRESGLAALLPSWPGVWVGLSAGSMIMAPRIGAEFVRWTPPGTTPATDGVDTTLGLVDFSLFPHLDHPSLPSNTMPAAERWAANLGSPAYVLDDDSAIVVDGADVRVVSEGSWRLIEP